jgi:hypothetical protein
MVGPFRLLPAAFALFATLGTSAARPDPTKVVGPDDCGECHEEAHDVWLTTAHARGWTELSRSEEARALAAKLGVRRIKRDERCVSCHFLSAEVAGVVKPIAGVACESCHGAAADWIDLHWDFGPNEADAETETPEHRAQRLRRSEAAGLVRPEKIAMLASACYDCHVIADEELIEAGHPVTGPFELAAATQSEMRHNFVRGQGENAVSSIERLRVLHALGRLLDWSATLRALSVLPAESAAAGPLGERAAELRELVAGLHALTPRPEFETALAAGASAPPAEAADAIREAASALVEAEDGASLSGLDGLLPSPLTAAAGG